MPCTFFIGGHHRGRSRRVFAPRAPSLDVVACSRRDVISAAPSYLCRDLRWKSISIVRLKDINLSRSRAAALTEMIASSLASSSPYSSAAACRQRRLLVRSWVLN
ncbi:hypothetical protein TIFTF001_054530 [Ficus carica]|uniref:Uncharacterized protein n=1 Tax=Ficus carica TaxID=3494 RepID=A0AA88EAL5_FICCA|nr:hypothetical protein TIFTF001_054529 [Ficus carica]GMN70795.1 hypothetical protein TIFTF001_054530 [Ficus carica]